MNLFSRCVVFRGQVIAVCPARCADSVTKVTDLGRHQERFRASTRFLSLPAGLRPVRRRCPDESHSRHSFRCYSHRRWPSGRSGCWVCRECLSVCGILLGRQFEMFRRRGLDALYARVLSRTRQTPYGLVRLAGHAAPTLHPASHSPGRIGRPAPTGASLGSTGSQSRNVRLTRRVVRNFSSFGSS